MRDTSLRWGLGMGVLSAALGTGALLLGAFIEPFKQVTTADAVALALFVRGMLVLISLGIALGLAYYAGLRVARAYFQSLAAAADSTETATNTAIASLLGSTALGTSLDRKYTVLAGGLTMFCFWLITSMYIFVLPPTNQTVSPQGDILSFVETRLLLGVIYVFFGLGLGGLGGRAPAARLLLDRLTLPGPSAAPIAKPASTLPAAPASTQPEPQPAAVHIAADTTPETAAGVAIVPAASMESVSETSSTTPSIG